MSDTGKKLLKGSGLRVLEFFASAIVGLVMMPFIIRSLGDRIYGLWIFVGSFLGYYGLLDLGLGSAVQRYVSRAVGLKDYEEINKVLNTALVIFSVLGLIAFFVSIIFSIFLPLLIKNITEVALFRKIILILGLNFAVAFPLRVFFGILSANLRYDISAVIEISKLVLRTVLIIVFFKLGFGIMALALITIFTDLLSHTTKYFVVRGLYQYIRISLKFVDISKVRLLFNYSKYAFIAQIANQLRFNIDNLVITIFLGLNFVTPYSIAARLIKYFGELIRSVVGMLVPVFSQYEAKGDYDGIREKFIFTTKISGYLSTLIGGTLIIFGQAFIRKWVGQEYLGSYVILLVLIVPTIFSLMQTPSWQLAYGISKHKFFAILNTVEGLVNLMLSIILVKKFGLVGVALGTAIPMIFSKLLVQPIYICRMIDLDVVKYYLKVLFPVLLKSTVFFIAFWLVFKQFIVPNYLNLLILIFCEFVLFVGAVFFVGFNDVERDHFRFRQ